MRPVASVRTAATTGMGGFEAGAGAIGRRRSVWLSNVDARLSEGLTG
jgi:hypothetical protein